MKRSFRPAKATRDRADYPLEEEGRRAFLRRLAAGLVGGAGLALLGACGSSRAVGGKEAGADTSPHHHSMDGGIAPMPDAQLDLYPPPLLDSMGAAPMPDAKIDSLP